MSGSNPLITKEERDYYPALPHDEISLVDLWLALARHNNLMGAIFAAVVAIGAVYTIARSETYEYKTTVEIGKIGREDGSKVELIQKPQTVQAKIKESYIPVVLNEYARQHPNNHEQYTIEATVPKNSELVVLTAQGPERDAELYKSLLGSVVILQIKDHRRLIDAERRLLKSKLARLGDLEKLLSAEIEQLDSQIARVVATQAKAQTQAKNAPDAMTILLAEGEIQRNRNRLGDLRERLDVKLKNERVALGGRLSTLQETRSVTDPFQSKEPVGPKAPLIMAFSALIGGMLAVFGAFFAEFLGKVRKVEQTDEQT